MSQGAVGYVIGISLVLSVLSSLFGGQVVDKIDRRILLLAGFLLLAISNLCFPFFDSTFSVLAMLSLSYSTVSVLEITIKAYIAQLVEVDHRIRAFSLCYTLSAVGYAVGPLLGAALAIYNLDWLFYVSGIVALIIIIPIFYVWSHLPSASAPWAVDQQRSFSHTLGVLRNDRRLMIFLFGGILAAVIHARWSAYLAQYLAVVTNAEIAFQTVAYIIATNAVVVILLQYIVGSKINTSNIHKGLRVGLVFFALGMVGFSTSTTLWVWLISIIVFTVGEIIFTPASYLFVDRLAPENMKGSYYGAQNLTNFGGAFSPIICGLLLSTSTPGLMFYMLLVVAGLSMWLFDIAEHSYSDQGTSH